MLPKLRGFIRRSGFGLALFGATALVGQSASASVVERIVAIVGEKPILLSDLRERARPMLMQIEARSQNDAQRAAAVSTMYQTLLQRMIDEELQRGAATSTNVRVTDTEIDEAIERVARQQSLTTEQLITEARRSGLSEQQYRGEIQSQLLEAKLLNMRLTGRVHITDEDLRAQYQRYVLEERRNLGHRIAWIRLKSEPSPASAGADGLQAAKEKAAALARAVAAQAAAGADFTALARKHSTDSASAENGGRLPEAQPAAFGPAIARVLTGLDVGGVSGVVRDGGDLVIVKLLARAESELPSFAESRAELEQRVYMEKMAKAREQWMETLRRRTVVDVRL